MQILEDNPAIKWLEDRGMSKGMNKKMVEIARNMLRRGRNIQEVSEDTGLEISKVAELQTELQAQAV